MAHDDLTLVSLAERRDLEDALDRHNTGDWPEYMLHDPVAAEHWHHLHGEFADWQLMLLDPMDRIVAAANSAPLAWDGTDEGLPEGWDEQFRLSVEQHAAGVRPDALGAIQIVSRRSGGATACRDGWSMSSGPGPGPGPAMRASARSSPVCGRLASIGVRSRTSTGTRPRSPGTTGQVCRARWQTVVTQPAFRD